MHGNRYYCGTLEWLRTVMLTQSQQQHVDVERLRVWFEQFLMHGWHMFCGGSLGHDGDDYGVALTPIVALG
jgi:hypothetical protein